MAGDTHWTMIADGRQVTAPLTQDGDALLIGADTLDTLLGWHVTEGTLCRDDRCLPLARHTNLAHGDKIDLAAFAALLEMPLAIEAGAQALAVGAAPDELARTLREGIAPDFCLPDLAGREHRLSDHRGRKVLLVTWATWCGCREDLSAWQALFAELEPAGLSVITIAQDRDVEEVRPFIERANPGHPSLIDAQHVVFQRYGFINVPTAIWIDENGQIARPPRVEHASNLFQFAHGLDCEPHMAALRTWVATGQTDFAREACAQETMPPTAADQAARAEHALAFYLYNAGLEEAAGTHWDRAIQLAPFDWTIRRGSMGMRGQNPFGSDFATVWEEWENAGRPDYASLARTRGSVAT